MLFGEVSWEVVGVVCVSILVSVLVVCCVSPVVEVVPVSVLGGVGDSGWLGGGVVGAGSVAGAEGVDGAVGGGVVVVGAGA